MSEQQSNQPTYLIEQPVLSPAANGRQTLVKFGAQVSGSKMALVFVAPGEITQAAAERAAFVSTYLPSLRVQNPSWGFAPPESLVASAASVAQTMRAHLAGKELEQWQTNAIPSAGRMGCFFSGGIDSWYTVLSLKERLTDLVYVHGFDIDLRNEALRNLVMRELRQAARSIGKPLVEVASNVKQFGLRFCKWGEEYHGSALASVAHLLAPSVPAMVMGPSYSPGRFMPWGSHPGVDPLWSTSDAQIIHYDPTPTRLGRLKTIADNPVVRQTLRVCWENRNGGYNCGICGKCVRTMILIESFTSLKHFRTFPQQLDLDLVRSMPLAVTSIPIMEDALAELETNNTKDALRSALEMCISTARRK